MWLDRTCELDLFAFAIREIGLAEGGEIIVGRRQGGFAPKGRHMVKSGTVVKSKTMAGKVLTGCYKKLA